MNRMLFATTAVGVKTAPVTSPHVTNSSGTGGEFHAAPGNAPAGDRRAFSTPNLKWVHIGYVLIDIFLVSISGLVAFCLRFVPLSIWRALHTAGLGLPENIPLKPYGGFLLLYTTLIVLLGQNQDLYRTPRERTASQESWAVIRTVTLATAALAAFIFCSNVKIVSREVVAVSASLNVFTLVAWRLWKRRFVARRVVSGIGARNALIVGAGRIGQDLALHLERNKHLGYRVTGFLDGNHSKDPRLLGRIEDLSQVARAHFVDDVFVTIPSERDVVKNLAVEARRQRLCVKVVPDMYDGLAWNAPIQQIGEFPVIELHWEPIPTLGLFVKRLADVVVSTIALIVLSPVFLMLALAIKLDSPGPVFYKSKRVGRKGTTFTFYKFRTMVADADKLKEGLQHLNERSNGLLFKIADDPRVTSLGKILRRYSIDELPQLWNVLRGEMSLVGPRPPLPGEFDQYSLEHLRRLDVKPGITGLWQVSARLDPSFENYLALDLAYIEKWGFWMDAKILWKTIPVVMRGQGR